MSRGLLLLVALGLALPQSGPRVRTIEVGGGPNAVAVGQGGVWVVGGAERGGFITRIDPGTNRVVARIVAPVGSERACGAATGFGAVWAASPSAVLRIDPRANRVTGAIAVPGATCVAVGFGSVWVTSAERRTVTEIDPRSIRPPRMIAAGTFPEGVAVGYGSVWIASGQLPCGSAQRPCTATIDESGELVRLDPRTRRAVAKLRLPHSPAYLAVGAGGVWVSSNDGRVRRIDPRTNRVVARIDITGGGRTTLAVGLGRVWVTALHGPGPRGVVVPVDPRTGSKSKPITVGESPIGMTVGYGALWVANFNGGTVSKIEP